MFSFLPHHHFVRARTQKLVVPHLYNLSLKICRSISSENSTSSTKNIVNEDCHSSSNTCTESLSLSSSSSLPSFLQNNDKEQLHLKAGLKRELIPKHIAVILDGNRRWLKAQGKRTLDYGPFFQKHALLADLCIKYGVATTTIFVYSYDNVLQRGQEANDLFFGQLERFIGDNLENFIRKQIRVKVIGARKECTNSLQDMLKQVEEATSGWAKPQLELRLAICYAGTRDILQATRRLGEKVKAGAIEPNDIDVATFDRELEAGGAPTPELLIRVGGELRLSNFLVWHLAVTEYYFNPIKAPEFTEDHFVDALRSFQQRDRNFGK